VLWAGAPSPYTVLVGNSGCVYDIYGSDKCGARDSHAAVWAGSGNAYTDIHPASLPNGASYARSMWGDVCGGAAKAELELLYRAYVWQKISGSWVPSDVHPAGYMMSRINDVAGNPCVGGALSSGYMHAYMWNLYAPELNKDLHPILQQPKPVLESEANAQAGAAQGGVVRFQDESVFKAAMWFGSRETYQSMHPTGKNASAIFGMAGQGVDIVSGGYVDNHASLWLSLNAGNYVDLNPAGWYSSSISAVVVQGNKIYAVGTGSPVLGTLHAVLWTYDIPEPGTLAALFAGLAGFAGFALRRRK
jgi:hypothetical protein